MTKPSKDMVLGTCAKCGSKRFVETPSGLCTRHDPTYSREVRNRRHNREGKRTFRSHNACYARWEEPRQKVPVCGSCFNLPWRVEGMCCRACGKPHAPEPAPERRPVIGSSMRDWGRW